MLMKNLLRNVILAAAFLAFNAVAFSQIPTYSIGTVNTEDANGEPDSSGVECKVVGVVLGVDLSGTSSSSNTFTIVDATGGIGVFKGGGFTPPYTVTEGDSVRIIGTVSFYNGLVQMDPDSIVVLGTGAAIPTPAVVTDLDKSTESNLVMLENVRLINPSQWPSSGSNANVDIRTPLGDTLTMRIDRDTDVDDLVSAPDGYFDLIGIGGQFDFSSPYDEGYQIFPRYASDVMPTPFYYLNQINTEDANGEPDSNGVRAHVAGQVVGINYQGPTSPNLSFTIIDSTGGINVFRFGGVTPSYTVKEGDSIALVGSILFYNGLVEIGPEFIEVLDTGTTLPEPALVTTLGKSTESNYIRMEYLRVVDPLLWPTLSGNNANVDVVTLDDDTLVMRIDRDTDIDGNVPLPTGYFHVTGIGGQFDASSPYLDGYQIFPRYISDIEIVPLLPIGTVNTEDANGEPDSAGVSCTIKGIVLGVDLQGNASSNNLFTIVDQTGGISTFKGGGFTPPYTVNEGDSVELTGEIEHFNGLVQMAPVAINVLNSNNPIPTPTVVTTLGKATESQLVRINGVYLADPMQWPTTSGFNANVDIVTPNNDTLVMRIDRDTDIDGVVPAPMNKFDVIGIGGQFDSSSPYDEGYQLFPHYDYHIIPIVETPTLFINEVMSSNVDVESDENGDFDDWIEIYNNDGNSVNLGGMYISDDMGNTTKFQFAMNESDLDIADGEFLLLWADDETSEGVKHLNFTLDNTTSNYVGLYATDGSTVIDSVTVPALDDNISYGRETDGSNDWVTFAVTTPEETNSNGVITAVRNFTVSNEGVAVFPNPSSDKIFVKSTESFQSIRVYDVVGNLVEEIFTNNDRDVLDVSEYKNGVYIMTLQFTDRTINRRVVVQ